MIRVTPDTNVLVEAAISGRGPAGEIVTAWVTNQLTLVTCEEIVAEYEEALRRADIQTRYSHITEASIARSGAGLRRSSAFITLADVPRIIVEDPDDDIVLACGVAGRADFLVSRDHHLLNLRVHHGIPIVTAEAFLRLFHGQVREEVAIFVPSRARR